MCWIKEPPPASIWYVGALFFSLILNRKPSTAAAISQNAPVTLVLDLDGSKIAQ